MTGLTLPILPSGYWMHAHGEGGGADFDLVMERDADGLPLLRGRHVKGLLRLALLRAEAWNWFENPKPPSNAAELLLGADGGKPGCLSVGDARVSAGLRARLKAEPTLIEGLFARIAATALESATGVAKPKSLRTLEAAIPVPLRAAVDFAPARREAWARDRADEVNPIENARKNWEAWVKTAWPAFDEVGAKRTRGFGALEFVGIGS